MFAGGKQERCRTRRWMRDAQLDHCRDRQGCRQTLLDPVFQEKLGNANGDGHVETLSYESISGLGCGSRGQSVQERHERPKGTQNVQCPCPNQILPQSTRWFW